MKMTRSKLKGLVKECLVEILAEGIGQKAQSSASLKESNQRAIATESKRLEAHRKKLDRKITQTVSSLTNDDVMRDILADTARTTLQEQMNHDNQPGRPSTAGPGIDLDNIFTGASQNWSELAFSDKK